MRPGRVITVLVSLTMGASVFAAVPVRASNDPLFSQQWGLAQVRVQPAWAVSRGAGIVIAVVDSGVDLGHPDLASKLVPGFDFVANTSTPQDLNGHGTHIAGVAAAATDNGSGIAGTAPDARIMPVRVLDERSVGTASNIAKGINFAVDQGAQIVNLSVAGRNISTTTLEPLRAAVSRANSFGVLVVASAGNDASEQLPSPICDEPASFAGVVCVAATDRREARSPYSNLPNKPDRIALSGPGGSGTSTCGENILSTVPRGTSINGAVCRYGGDYDDQVGTSQAAAFVSGIAALLMARGANRDDVIRTLTATSRQPGTGERGVFTPTFGYGIVDASAALGLPSFPIRTGEGYWLAASDGGIFSFGRARFHGSTGSTQLNQPIVDLAATPDGNGYWLVASDGGIFAFGSARFFGSTGGSPINQPIVGMAASPDGNGYWLVASDGGIFAFGSARFFGSTGATRLNQPIVAMAPAPDARGYWLVASDGGIFAFGSARFSGSTGATRLNQPIVSMSSTPDGNGYWLVASDGGIFAFGSARYHGSTGATRLNQPIVGMASTPDGNGYWLVASDGGIFAFGSARFFGSTGAIRLNRPIVALAYA
ncbi:MAG TPA: S8 family serine peptidase [Acidimicrobiales bacterium]|nr:S8 family serine peptidase [Acidimicrobiales bacterium]